MSSKVLSLKYSHNIIEHLGLKLYQNKPTNVIAELISNSWDANATEIKIALPSDKDANQIITVSDNGYGMSLKDLQENYLVIGKRKEVARTSPNGRCPMGRKGIGKLAPFGIANTVSIFTVKEGVANLFEIDYTQMVKEIKDENHISKYTPNHIINNIEIGCFSEQLEKEDIKSLVYYSELNKFTKNLLQKDKKSGTLIVCSNIKLSKTINSETLLESIGRRFTVTLNRPDFIVLVNDIKIEEKHCFPDWAFRIPEQGSSTVTTKCEGKSVEIKYWVGFVDQAEWSADEAGVGVYSHGKIAQDRPFTFGVKGSEIFTRYMYGVVEADWVDELAEDEISTDRTSINWDNEIFNNFHEWGQTQVKHWIKEFRIFKSNKAKDENRGIIDEFVTEKEINLRGSEKDHLNDIISEITPNMSPDLEQRNRLIDATLKAWLHEPSRQLIKKLWNQTSDNNSDEFANLVIKLEDELVPESLSLAVMFSQRIYALTKLDQNIKLKQETHLQILIESFPWILGDDYQKFVFRKSLKNIVESATEEGLIKSSPIKNKSNDQKQPDFVFFSDSDETNILIVELKGPDITAEWEEYDQLQNYMNYFQRRSPDSNVTGILIAGNFAKGIDKQRPPTMEFKTWDTVLRKSRKEHAKYLAALLDGAEADPNDARVMQICDLGGEVVMDFIKSMSSNSEILSDLIKNIERQESSRLRTKKAN